jgi:hypothetical protein
MTKLNKSPERHTFQANNSAKTLETETDPEKIASLNAYLAWWEQVRHDDIAKEDTVEWQKDNLEYDLRSTDWLVAKCKANLAYSQNLYAALCNNDFMQLKVMPILKDEKWSCSWRHAGGIIADILEEGDYIDWYCSGMGGWKGESTDYVQEGTVTDEIRADLKNLGWIVVEDNG